jgi:hypothetical protein
LGPQDEVFSDQKFVPRQPFLIHDVGKSGVRIAVGLNSAYNLYLIRTLKNATILRAKTGGGRAMIELFLNDKLDAAAGVRQQLESYAMTGSKMRVMEGRFMEIQQSMGTPKGRTAGAGYLSGVAVIGNANLRRQTNEPDDCGVREHGPPRTRAMLPPWPQQAKDDISREWVFEDEGIAALLLRPGRFGCGRTN